MRKIISLLLTVAMLFSMCACLEDIDDGIEESNEASESDEKDNTENGGETEADDDSDDETEGSDETEIETETETEAETESEDDDKVENEFVFEEIIAIDNEECVIKITDFSYDIFMGYSLKAYLENKSSDKTYMYSVDSAAINGVESDPFFAAEVAAGKKSNESIYFSDSDLEVNGSKEFTDIELTFRVYNSDDWMADDVANVTVHVYPYGEDKAEKFVRDPQENDNVLIDNDYVTVIVTGYENDDFWGYTANLFLVNKTDKTVMFTVEDVSVNGFMADPFYATTVHAGKVAFSSISWSDTALEENDITDIEEIEMTVRAYDEDDWFGGDFANKTVTLNP